ncbi:MAG TPA: glycosyltransferase [Candidatus Doudnabacteria bacterium]|nr:glycosyltransferase [Candidatus Doudnabacteria bacterium]
MNKKILILHTSIGLGHKYIAQNIAFHLQNAGHEVLVYDILDVEKGFMVDFGTWIHSFINRRLPFVWRWLYFSELVNVLAIPLRIPLAKSNSQNLLKIVKEFEPDCIISTQTTSSAATASLIRQKQYSGKFVIAFSDYHLHKMWLYDEADQYLVNIDEQKSEMISLGVPQSKIVVCGITLKPKVDVNESGLRQQLNIPPHHRIIIFGSGSLGIGFDYALLKNFLIEFVSRNENYSVVVLCGKNETFKVKLESEKLSNTIPLGFFQNPSQLYQIADLLVTKPGGLTIAEALQSNVRILITHTLPGQEEPNYEYLVSNGLVEPKPEPLSFKSLSDTATAILSSSEKSLSDKAAKLINFKQEGKTLLDSIENLFHNV